MSAPFSFKSSVIACYKFEREREREREFSVRQLPTGFCESYSKGYLILKGNLCQQVCVEPPPSALSVMLLFAAECQRLRHTCSY